MITIDHSDNVFLQSLCQKLYNKISTKIEKSIILKKE